MRHVVMFSGGIGSWATAKRVAERHGTKDLTLLFSDTLIEDDDLYRWLDDASQNVGAELCKIAEGRDPWQVFFDVRFLGNTRIDPCSRVLKRELLRQWLEANCAPSDTCVYLGIDWTERHRFDKAQGYWHPWTTAAPLCEAPYMSKKQVIQWARTEGLQPPRLYDLGFPHNNCGGFCIKAGQAQFELLLRRFPDRYRYHERREQELREHLGKDVAILRDRFIRNGEERVVPLSLREFRERLESQPALFDGEEWGGCACFTPDEYAEAA